MNAENPTRLLYLLRPKATLTFRIDEFRERDEARVDLIKLEGEGKGGDVEGQRVFGRGGRSRGEVAVLLDGMEANRIDGGNRNRLQHLRRRLFFVLLDGRFQLLLFPL